MINYILLAGLLFPSPVQAETLEQPQVQYIMTSKASIEDYITARAMANGYRPDLAVAIAKAESGLSVNAKNASSTASGLFQFINGTFMGFCVRKYGLANSLEQKNDPFVQIECATKMLAEGGESHWSESEGVWERVR